MTALPTPCSMPALSRSRRSAPAAGFLLVLLSACAVNHSENFVSLVITQETGAPTLPLSNVAVVVVAGRFGETTNKGKAAPGMETIANRQLGTLLPALRLQLPGVLRRNGIAAQTVQADQPPVADDVITIKPKIAQDFSNGSGGGSIGITLAIEIRSRTGALVWNGTALERSSPSRPDTMQWSDAMAEDLARTLLIRLNKESVVKLGAGADAEPI